MKIDTMSSFNVPSGMSNNELLHALDDLIDGTGDTVYWTAEQFESSKIGFTTTNILGHRVEVAFQGQDVEATITDITDTVAGDRIIGRVDAVHPPELRVRSKLAGTAFALFKLAEAHRT